MLDRFRLVIRLRRMDGASRLAALLLGACLLPSALAEQLPKRPSDAISIIDVVSQSRIVSGDGAANEGCDNANTLITRLLEVEINQTLYPNAIIAYQRPCGALLVSTLDMRDFRIVVPRSTETVEISRSRHLNLNEFKGLVYTLDVENQRLVIEGEPWIFRRQRIDFSPERRVQADSSSFGASVNYGAFATYGTADDTLAGTLFTRAVGFSPWGVLDSTWIGQWDEDDIDVARLNTQFRTDFPRWITSLTVGDFSTRGGAWGGSSQVGGIQYATNFGTRPGFRFFPTASIDLLIDRASIGSLNIADGLGRDADDPRQRAFARAVGDIEHGPVEIVGVPTLRNGAYRFRLRDLNGQIREVSRGLFFSNNLLRKGVHDFSYGVGLRRESISTDADRYDGMTGSATHRYGALDWLTLEAHAEADEQTVAAGGSAAVSVPYLGVLEGVIAGSRADTDTGTGVLRNDASQTGGLASLSVENRFRLFGYATRARCTERDFQLVGGGLTNTRCQYFASGTASVPRIGSIAASYAHADRRGSDDTAGVTLTLTSQLPRLGFNVFLSARRQVSDSGDWSGFLSMTQRLQGRAARRAQRRGLNNVFARLNARAREGDEPQADLQLNASHNRPGHTFSGLLSAGVLNDERVAARLDYSGPRATAFLDAQNLHEDPLLSFGGTSGFLWIDRYFRVTRPQLTSFALVRLGENSAGALVNGVPADRNGNALILPLQPYSENVITLNASDLPLNTVITQTRYNVVPRYLSGVVLDIPLERSVSVLMRIDRLRGGQREAIGAGTIVTTRQSDWTVSPANSDGAVYVTGILESQLGQTVTMTAWIDGRACRVDVPLDRSLTPADDALQRIPQIGPYLCEP